MAFNLQNFATVSSTANKDAKTIWSYNAGTDTLATVLASAYFASINTRLAVEDLIYVTASDTSAFIQVTAISPNVTTTVFVQPETQTIFASGVASNGGGSASIAITVTGVLTTDAVFAQVATSTNAVTVQKVTPTANTITVVLSADPGASTKISYLVIRPVV